MVIVVLARSLAEGELAEVSVVFGLSLIGSVLPIAVQARASADAADGQEPGRLPWRVLLACSGGLMLVSWPLAALLHVGVAATFFPALLLLPLVSVARTRGDLVGRGHLGAAGLNNLVEAAVRLAAGVGLGLAIGADGVAMSLVLAAVAAWFAAPHLEPGGHPLRIPAALVATALVLAGVQIDIVLAPRLLGGDADAYVSAALPAKGVYVALAALAWVVIPRTLGRPTLWQQLRPIGAMVVLGFSAAGMMALGAPIIGAVMDRPTPSRMLVGVLAAAMSLAGASWTMLQLRMIRRGPRAWLSPAAALVVTAVVAGVGHSPGWMALGVIAGQTLAVALAVAALRVDVRERGEEASNPARSAAGRTSTCD